MHISGAYGPHPLYYLVRSLNHSTNGRLPRVWGDDANDWNAGRFLKTETVKQTSIGVYGNL